MLRVSLPGPLAVALVGLLLAGCGSRVVPAAAIGPAAGSPLERLAKPIDKIQHVVIIVQENRTFNNLFYGFPGARTQSYGYGTKGQKIGLLPVTLATTWGPEHDAAAYLAACHGKGKIPGTDCRMNGFDDETWSCGGSGQAPCPIKNPPYAYVPHSETKPYFDLGKQYVLADEMYASDFDESSFESHQYIIAATDPDASVDYPNQQWGCSGHDPDTDKIRVLQPDRVFTNNDTVYPCWNPTTLGDELDHAGLSWAYYAVTVSASDDARFGGKTSRGKGIWSAYQAIKHIYGGKDWSENVISPPSQFLTDVAAGKLADVTWVTPTYQNSDHAGSGYKTGPSWVASVVNAVGRSKFWPSSAIFIFWDDPGGWYDPAPPAYVDNDGLGMRLPLLIVSPYAKKGYVSHTHYEHGSLLKFIEERFDLPPLAVSDRRAANPYDEKNSGQSCFDFSQAPRKFAPIAAEYPASFFERQPLDLRPPDTN